MKQINIRGKEVTEMIICNRLILCLLICLVCLVGGFSQATITQTESCGCIPNGAPSGSAQFYNAFEIQSGIGETWYFEAISGIYDTLSPAPPANQIPIATGPLGQLWDADATGLYTFRGISLENLPYSFLVSNGTDSLFVENYTCAYPSVQIEGDNAICEGEMVTYENIAFNPSYTYSWSVISKGVIVGPYDGASITVDWDDTATGHSAVVLSFENETGCSGTEIFEIEFEEPINLACNLESNHTVGPNCTLNLNASDILKDMQYNNQSYTVTVVDPSSGQVIPLGSNVSAYIGKQLEVSIDHICGENYCWGYIVLEDKYIPSLIPENDTILCTEAYSPEDLGYPLPLGTVINKVNDNQYIVLDWDQCSDVELSFTDEKSFYGCSEPYYGRIFRTWAAVDNQGNMDQIVDTIVLERTTISDIIWPDNYDDITLPALECSDTFLKLPNGNPHPDFTGYPSNYCSHLKVEYSDLESLICGATFKVVRKWKVYDPCTSTSKFHNQIIKVADTQKPTMVCGDTIKAHIDGVLCQTDIVVTIPDSIQDCSDVGYLGKYWHLDKTGNIDSPIITVEPNINGVYNLKNLIEGTYTFVHIVEDLCGNRAECTQTIVIKDIAPPTTICGKLTSISLNLEGYADVPVSKFDGGSYDNCTAVTLDAKRVNDNCGINNWTDNIRFCCADLGTSELVILRATDAYGNASTCLVEVEIQDKKAPAIYGPSNKILDCSADKDNLDQYGVATASDNCSYEITEEVSNYLNDCNEGTIYRKFIATDPAGNTSSFIQKLIFVGNTSSNNITWPSDFFGQDVTLDQLHPDSLPSSMSRPTLAGTSCANLKISYTDVPLISTLPNYCMTISRYWSVENTCDNALYSHVQDLHINDTQKPQFVNCSDSLLIGTSDKNCQFELNYTKEAIDNLTSLNDLVFNYAIDLNDNGFNDYLGTTNTIVETIPAGTHRILWSVQDKCGNINGCTEVIVVEDQKDPTPYCNAALTTVIMKQGGFVEIEASDFNTGSTDNCTDANELIFSFSADKSDQVKTFTCDDLEGLPEKLFDLKIYVHDVAGNFDFCSTQIKITENNHCQSTTDTMAIAGSIHTADQEGVANALVALYKNDKLVHSTTTDIKGNYGFDNMDMNAAYSVKASYEGDYLNGVTTLDIILIQKHILGIAPFDSPYKVIAADVNGSNSVTGSDIVQLRKLILGFYNELPNTTSWKVIDGQQSFPDPNKPWPYKESISTQFGNTPLDAMHFVSIKMGDVNYSRTMSVISNDIVTREEQVLDVFYKRDGDRYVFELEQAMPIIGLQMSFAGSCTAIESDVLSLSDNHMHVGSETTRISFSEPSNPTYTRNLFAMSVQQKVALDSGMSAEIYVQDGNQIRVFNVRLKEVPAEMEVLQVYQNQPNPFTDATTIPFDLGASGMVECVLQTIDGKKIYNVKKFYPKGSNVWILDEHEIDASGIVFYTLKTKHSQITRRMMIIQ